MSVQVLKKNKFQGSEATKCWGAFDFPKLFFNNDGWLHSDLTKKFDSTGSGQGDRGPLFIFVLKSKKWFHVSLFWSLVKYFLLRRDISNKILGLDGVICLCLGVLHLKIFKQQIMRCPKEVLNNTTV